MKKFIKSLIAISALLFGTVASAGTTTGYTLLNPAQPTASKNIEVLEFFSYGCSHCFHLHPEMSKWLKKKPKDVDFSYVPVIFRSSAEPLARAYYAVESLPGFETNHDMLYRAIHVDNADLFDLDSIANFVAKRGVDRAKFVSAYNSFSMESKIARAKQMIRNYAIMGTPTLIVDGKYVITGLQPADTMRVLDEVVAKARKEHGGKR